MQPAVIAIFGPTGVGKTAVAIALAERLRAHGEDPVAVSVDALQVYRGLETLTRAASAAEQRRLEHRLLAFVPVEQTYSVARHARLAHAEIDALLAAGRRPLVVGGTGLYLRAALTELSLRPAPPPELRAQLNDELRRRGAPALHAELARRAPWAAAGIDRNDGRRLVRALELERLGALRPHGQESQLWTGHVRHPTRLIGLVMERHALRARIAARVEQIVAAGARAEVLAAVAGGASQTARKALGFQELLDDDVEAMVRRTRQYARRQLTWMRKLAGVELIDVTGHDAAAVADELLARPAA